MKSALTGTASFKHPPPGMHPFLPELPPPLSKRQPAWQTPNLTRRDEAGSLRGGKVGDMPDNVNAPLGGRLQSIRKRRGLSQAELAGASGVSLSLIRQFEQGLRDDTRLETARKLAVALRVPTTALLITGEPQDKAHTDVAADWEPVRQALAGQAPAPVQEPTTAKVREAMHSLGPAMAASRYDELRDALPQLLADTEALGDRQLLSQTLNTTGYLLTQTRQYATAELTLNRAIETAPDIIGAASAADTMLWLHLRQGDLGKARSFAAQWADDTEPRLSRATILDLILWGRFLVGLTNAAIRDNCPNEAEDALNLAASAAARIGREVRRHDQSQCVFGPISVAYIKAETHVISGQPDQCLAVAATTPHDAPYPQLVSRLRHKLDVANAKAMLNQHGEAYAIIREVRERAPQWLAQQRYAQDIIKRIIAKRRTLTPQMREMADFIRVPY
jgi:transcriptional regulator with XRE-family HTH domain